MGRGEGLTDRDVLEIGDHRASDAFGELEKLALDYALCLTETPAEVPEDLFQALRAHLDEAQLIELSAVAAWENYLARSNRGFDVAAQGFSEGAVCPIPDHAERRAGIQATERARA